ncbi:hypothetical protein [Paenisporosarcina sp. NPDC076898]|uniref:hypothetical protein n=1 Tax=unclassified Paenisporosarcina TaxID=2642018 RepID=UPI003D01481D
MKKNLPIILQTIGLLGFVLAFLQYEIGWFIGFFCTGIFFIMDKESKQKNFSKIVGVLALLYSFYNLFTKVNLF